MFLSIVKKKEPAQRRYNVIIGKPEKVYPYVAISPMLIGTSFEIEYRTNNNAAYVTTCREQPSRETAKTLVQRIEDFLQNIPQIPTPVFMYFPDEHWEPIKRILKRKYSE